MVYITMALWAYKRGRCIFICPQFQPIYFGSYALMTLLPLATAHKDRTTILFVPNVCWWCWLKVKLIVLWLWHQQKFGSWTWERSRVNSFVIVPFQSDTSVACRYKCRLYLNFRGCCICQIFGYIGGSLFIPNSRQFPKVTFYIK